MDPISKAQAEIVPQNRQTLRKKRHVIDPQYGIPTRFKPGVSGNPGGRPKTQPVTKMLREIFENQRLNDEIKDSMALTLKSGRMAGILLFREAAERLEGKVMQPVEVDGNLTLSLAETISKRRKALDDSEP